MDVGFATTLIYQDADFNPACFDFNEEEARAKKLWRDERPMPSMDELKSALDNFKKETEYKSKRLNEYEKRGLNFDKFIEALIENDADAMADFRSKRNEVKGMFPKP